MVHTCVLTRSHDQTPAKLSACRLSLLPSPRSLLESRSWKTRAAPTADKAPMPRSAPTKGHETHDPDSLCYPALGHIAITPAARTISYITSMISVITDNLYVMLTRFDFSGILVFEGFMRGPFRKFVPRWPQGAFRDGLAAGTPANARSERDNPGRSKRCFD